MSSGRRWRRAGADAKTADAPDPNRTPVLHPQFHAPPRSCLLLPLQSFYGICRSPPAIVTEWCANGSLAELLHRALCDPGVAAELTWPRRLAMVGC